MLAAVAGGVGAARLLRGMVAVADPHDIVVVVNTGDDVVLHGLHVSPDLDTITYTLAGAVSADQGWGLEGETWQVMDSLERYGPVAPAGSSAGQTWFRLGDRDLATHLYRTQRLAEGAGLTEATAEITRAWGLGLRLLPMSDDRVETRVRVAEGEIGFQDYFVGRRHAVAVEAVRFHGAEKAAPAPGVLEALAAADRIVVCPSNPIVSVGPVLAVPGIAETLQRRRDEVVAVSPIVAGAALKGPAGRLLTELGHECSVVGVARLYASFAASMVIDEADAALADAVAAEGVRPVVAPAVMSGPAEAAALARVVLS
ncbi:MAG: 2-phospho-L-lactate transferase [Actinobacteria bacterium]|nr:2-phospho-L-lactate transferase [Actinomycetota bacterium]MBW3650021.1 2-phospho-L-lactate transferase [Actinomycetota bacterium]